MNRAFRNTRCHNGWCSDAQLGTTPVAPFCVVAAGRRRRQRNPRQHTDALQRSTALRLCHGCGVNAPNGVVRAQADPLRDRAVLLLLLPQDALDLERLVRRLRRKQRKASAHGTGCWLTGRVRRVNAGGAARAAARQPEGWFTPGQPSACSKRAKGESRASSRLAHARRCAAHSTQRKRQAAQAGRSKTPEQTLGFWPLCTEVALVGTRQRRTHHGVWTRRGKGRCTGQWDPARSVVAFSRRTGPPCTWLCRPKLHSPRRTRARWRCLRRVHPGCLWRHCPAQRRATEIDR